MGLTSFNPNNENWQEIIIQEKPDEDRWTVVFARVLTSGSMSYLKEMAEALCQ